jgi:hypothetical protein
VRIGQGKGVGPGVTITMLHQEKIQARRTWAEGVFGIKFPKSLMKENVIH